MQLLQWFLESTKLAHYKLWF